MSLDPGAKLGTFEITGLLGKGGMGEVFRARDSKLGREVAIKVLPEEVASDREYLGRFQREAVALAALNHPNIAGIHEFRSETGDEGETHFLVMELVEGETLSERIAAGALAAEEAIPIFIQIAEGLEAAHERSIVHRDLKPANIKITPKGVVKILDFGLAKDTGPRAPQVASPDAPTRPISPTPGTLTTAGMILGTPNYMSPEQARGNPVDHQSDIWAFGVCLYQALTGTLPFAGETIADIISEILQSEADWQLMPANTPAYLREIVGRCLERDPKFRLRDIGEAWVLLNRPPKPQPVSGSLSVQREVTRFQVDFPTGHYLSYTFLPFAISPVGDSLVCTLYAESKQHLYLRRMDELDFRLIPGTENARMPFFSPDGRRIAFSQNRAIRVAAFDGTGVRTLVECQSSPIGGVWTSEDVIVWGELNSGLQKVNADGTHREVLTTLDREKHQIFQSALCNASSPRWMLASVAFENQQPSGRMEFVSIRTGERRRIDEARGMGRITSAGHLIFLKDQHLCAIRTAGDPPRTIGKAVEALREVALDDDGVPLFDLSASGSLAYAPRKSVSLSGKIFWVSRTGVREEIRVPPNNYVSPRLSPDGESIALVCDDRAGIRQVHLLDYRRGVLEKISNETRAGIAPAWHPSGARLAFSSIGRESQFGIKECLLEDGSIHEISASPTSQFMGDFSPDGRNLVVIRANSLIEYSIYVRNEAGEEKPFVESQWRSSCPRFHPSGGYIAYMSNESGRWEVYLKPFLKPGRRIQVSLDGGSDPVWARDGSELFYRQDNTVLTVRIDVDGPLKIGPPEALFQFDFGGKVSPFVASFDVHPDGERFVIADLVAGDRGATSLVVVRNWTDELDLKLRERSD